MHPFEIYKFYLSIKFHFTSKKFIFNFQSWDLKHINFSSFDGTQNSIVCSSLQRFPKEELLKLFVSNLVLEPKKPLNYFKFSGVFTTQKEWERRISKIETLFLDEMKNNILINVHNFKDLKDKLFMKPIERKIRKIDSLDSIFNSSMEYEEFTGIYLDDWIDSCSPETIAILDYIYFQKYEQSFLEELIKKEFKPYDNYLRIWKYQHFLNLNKIMNSEKIQNFQERC